MTKRIETERDEDGYEVEDLNTPEHRAEIRRIEETGERLNYKSAGPCDGGPDGIRRSEGPMLHATPLGYATRRPITPPPIDRRALMQNAHRIALELPRGALLRSHGGLGAGEEPSRDPVSRAAGRAPLTEKGNEASRRATRRTGSSMIGS